MMDPTSRLPTIDARSKGGTVDWCVSGAVLLAPFCLWFSGIIVLSTLKIVVIFFVGFFVVLPVVFRFSHTLQRSIIFLNFIQWPRNVDFWEPWKLGLRGTRNLRIHSDPKVSLGVWHMLPEVYANSSQADEGINAEDGPGRKAIFDAYLLNTDRPVILYAHGNSNSRAASHRIELYKLLQNLQYHVIALDYRSYGDSSNVEPSEQGLVEDTLAVYRWILSKINPEKSQPSTRAPIFIWGHSLGTGVSTHLVHELYTLGNGEIQQPAGLILESPFNSMQDEIYVHPFAKLFSWLPYYGITVVQALKRPGLLFASADHICAVGDIPLMVLHAKDDRVVPYELGLKLYTDVVRARDGDKMAAETEMHSFNASFKYGHKYIFKAPELPDLVKSFVATNLRPAERGSSTLLA